MMDGSTTQAGVSDQRANPNVNCLYGKRCPKCGSYGPLEVAVSMRILLADNGCEDATNNAIEYDDDSAAVCHACRYEGKFSNFDE